MMHDTDLVLSLVMVDKALEAALVLWLDLVLS